MHSFFVDPSSIAGQRVTLPGAVAHQVARVLRLAPGALIKVLDGDGWEYTVQLDRVGATLVTGEVKAKRYSEGEPLIAVTLYQAVLKSDRFEFVLQKGTELGVSRFVPVLCERSVPQGNREGWAEKRGQRWRKIIREAAEQSGRGQAPQLDPAMNFKDACENVDGVGLIPWEEERETSLKEALQASSPLVDSSTSLSVFIGPEGGFTNEEIDYATSNGIVPVTLGNRVLRAETAAVTTVAAVMYQFGELG